MEFLLNEAKNMLSPPAWNAVVTRPLLCHLCFIYRSLLCLFWISPHHGCSFLHLSHSCWYLLPPPYFPWSAHPQFCSFLPLWWTQSFWSVTPYQITCCIIWATVLRAFRFVFVCMHVCECLCFREKNRSSCSFGSGFLILATKKRAVFNILVLLPWQKQY